MKKINRKYLFEDECSSKILDFAEQHEYFSDRKLEIRTYEDSTILPPLVRSWKENPISLGGCLDRNEKYIEYSAMRGSTFDYRENIVIDNYRMNESYECEDIKYSDETVFYAGLLIYGWGHFLLECISRLWPIVKNSEEYKDIKIVFLPMYPIEKLDGAFLDILKLIGIKEEQIILLSSPTKFKSVIIPEPCTEAGIFYTQEYKFLVNHIISKAMEKTVKIKTYKKIYLSRKSWTASSCRDIGEDKIEKFFNKNGFVSISPEKYSAVEQIHLLQKAEHIASTIGSLSHNLLFAKDNVKITIINKICLYNYLQFVVDDMKNLDVTYVDAYRTLYPASLGIGPFLFDINNHMVNYAKDINMKMPDKLGPDREDFLKYINIIFDEYDSIPEKSFYMFNVLYKNNFSLGLNFYSKRELMFKKYFHKIMWKLSFGEQKIRYFEKYMKYKNKLNKVNTAVSNGMESSKHMLRDKDESLSLSICLETKMNLCLYNYYRYFCCAG